MIRYHLFFTICYYRYNLQERRQGSEDVCEDPLFSDVQPELFEVPTVATLLALHDNYEPVSGLVELLTESVVCRAKILLLHLKIQTQYPNQKMHENGCQVYMYRVERKKCS